MLKPTRAKLLADLLPNALGPAAAKQGFAGAEIVARWAAIVGPEIAAFAAPVKLATAARSPDGTAAGVLTLRVEGAFALEVQHRAPEIVERINAHLGWRCVGGLKIRQGSTAALRRRARRPAPPDATEEEAEEVRTAVSPIEEPGLAEALERLGRAALAVARVTRP